MNVLPLRFFSFAVMSQFIKLPGPKYNN